MEISASSFDTKRYHVLGVIFYHLERGEYELVEDHVRKYDIKKDELSRFFRYFSRPSFHETALCDADKLRFLLKLFGIYGTDSLDFCHRMGLFDDVARKGRDDLKEIATMLALSDDDIMMFSERFILDLARHGKIKELKHFADSFGIKKVDAKVLWSIFSHIFSERQDTHQIELEEYIPVIEKMIEM